MSGASFFTAFSQETSKYEPDNFRGTVFSPVGPLYEGTTHPLISLAHILS